jgi:hypothetical protein
LRDHCGHLAPGCEVGKVGAESPAFSRNSHQCPRRGGCPRPPNRGRLGDSHRQPRPISRCYNKREESYIYPPASNISEVRSWQPLKLRSTHRFACMKDHS